MKEIFYCENCGKELPEEVSVCPYCDNGEPEHDLMRCENCGRELPKGKSVCPYCEDLHDDRPASVPQPQNDDYYDDEDVFPAFFENTGRKIKILAAILLSLGSLAGLVVAIVLFSRSYDLIGLGILVLIGGPLVSWVLALLIYGFGVTVEKQVSIDRKLDNLQSDKK